MMPVARRSAPYLCGRASRAPPGGRGGKAYAIAGRWDDAATLWKTVDTSFGQLDGRAWWLDQVGAPEQIESHREARKRLAPE